MSFLVDDNTSDLIRNLWPKEFKRFADDPDSYDDCLAWQAVPYDVVDVSDWLRLVKKSPPYDPSRPYIVANVADPDDDDGEVFEIAIRIQGFLEHASLGALGNWDGKEHSAPRATQVVTLGSGGYDEQWIATVRAINRLLNVAARLACPERSFVPPFKEAANERLVFKRRVFCKATPGMGRIPLEANHRAAELQRVMNVWHLDTPLEFGQLGRDGHGRRATHVVFNKGHFVDVTASIELIIGKDPEQAVKAQLKPSRVVLIGTEGVPKGRPVEKPKTMKISQRAGPNLLEGWAEYDGEYIPSVYYPVYSILDEGEQAGDEQDAQDMQA
ncbi:hypothetical protein AURDEDRAFT_122117 [Auricularia subglabra TFB-10046 SS5]|nr:hypothetical protein AURDEDRAFT_122117 [Auricularia subglabra TFB-10046 SS5]